MPIPSPDKGQDKNSFISNCMSNDTMKEEFPSHKQRLAVCHSKLKRKKAKGSDNPCWNDDEVDYNQYILY